jgi:hypothetical protein
VLGNWWDVNSFTNKKQPGPKPSPPVTSRLGKRCWGLPIFNEYGNKLHTICSMTVNLKMIIILEKDKITEIVKHKLLKKGLSLVGMSDKEIIFNKLKHQFH